MHFCIYVTCQIKEKIDLVKINLNIFIFIKVCSFFDKNTFYTDDVYTIEIKALIIHLCEKFFWT